MRKSFWLRLWMALVICLPLPGGDVKAVSPLAVLLDTRYQPLPFWQDWSNAALINTDDDWSGIPGIIGYRGDGLTGTTGADPQSLLESEHTVDVVANTRTPNTLTVGGIAEFDLADPVIALQGSTTADAPGLVLHLDTRGKQSIEVAYRLRDIDGSTDNSMQPVALQYRVGSSGNFTNVPAGFVEDATTGPELADAITTVRAVLPAAANNRTEVEVRILTANAAGADEWVGIDDIAVTGSDLTTCDTRINEVQGAGHRSPLDGRLVTICGVVTARRSSGFFMQEQQPDALTETSEAVYVYYSAGSTLSPGDVVSVTGTVIEYRSGGASGAGLTLTEIHPDTVTFLSAGSLPQPVIIGAGGRIPPTQIIDDDTTGGDVEIAAQPVFDPDEDGLDFFESLEGMRVQINNALVVGATDRNGMTVVLADGGSLPGTGLRSDYGGILAVPGDLNPERILLDDALIGAAAMPEAAMGQRFTVPLVGVLDYASESYRLMLTSKPVTLDNTSSITAEVAVAPPFRMRVASFNIHNLAPGDPRYPRLGRFIADYLHAPDILALQEIQDNDGSTNTGVVSASDTLDELVAAIGAAGGPHYEYRQIDPLDNQDGGAPGANIRPVFLFRPDRVAFVDRSGGTATTAAQVTSDPESVSLTINPGRIDPQAPAFTDSRKPLVGEFLFTAVEPAQKVFVIANHFVSKTGDDPLFGRYQPQVQHSQPARIQQARAVSAFAGSILALDPRANIIVLGDLNDDAFSLTLAEMGNLVNLLTLLPDETRYSYIFQGNSQQLDHILVSPALFRRSQMMAAHSNTLLPESAPARLSDHDPVLAVFDFSTFCYLPFVFR